MTLIGSKIPTTNAPPATERLPNISLRPAMKRLLAVLYIAVLFTPLIGTWRHWDPGGQFQENRHLASAPEFPTNYSQAVAYSDQWLSFYRDRFGFRNTLIRATAIAKLRGLNEDIDGNVLIGKNNWLFFRPDGDPNFIAFRGLSPMSERQLDVWQHFLERRDADLSARGIPFLVVIPPDKQTIYTEFLPDSAAVVVHRSHLDQIIDRLRRTHSPVRLVDLRSALLAAKTSDTLYYKTDSHWNDLGAYCAYRAIIDALNQIPLKWRITPLPKNDFDMQSFLLERGDLVRFIHVSRQLSEYSISLTLTLKPPFTISSSDMNEPRLPRLFLIRDSFADALIPLLSHHFSEVFYAHEPYIALDAIQRKKPDLVINEFVERFLYEDPPDDSDWQPGTAPLPNLSKSR